MRQQSLLGGVDRRRVLRFSSIETIETRGLNYLDANCAHRAKIVYTAKMDAKFKRGKFK